MENKIVLAEGVGELAIRTGKTLDQREPNVIIIEGDIESVSEFLLKRYNVASEGELKGTLPKTVKGYGQQFVDAEKAVVLADFDKGVIVLKLDPESFYGTVITAKLEESKELQLFNINEQVEMSREDLIKLFRFNKIHFADRQKCEDLIKALQKFSAKAYVDFAKEDDNRGNVQAMVNKKVETGIPSGFTLSIPIFRGQAPETVPVEICLDVVGTRVVFWFESVELTELIETRKAEIFQKQLASCVDFPVIFK